MKNNGKEIVGLLVVAIILAAILLVAFFVVTSTEGSMLVKPDIIMTPSHSDYLTVYCTNNGGLSLEYDEGSVSTGKLWCLPIRPE